jgi:glycosyltransferase involved in cell wall biosynthesis
LPCRGEIPDLASFRRLRDAIQASDLVEIHSLWNATTSTAAWLARRAGVPYVLTPRGMLDPLCLGRRAWRKQAYRRMVEQRTLEGASGFHFLSESEWQAARFVRRRDRPFVVVSPNSAPRDAAEAQPGALAARFPELAGRPVVLYLGRLDAIKGIDLQVRALAAMSPARRPVLLVVGPDYGALAGIRAAARREGVEPWLRTSPPVAGRDRYSLMSDARAVLLTSLYDANPVTVTEALAAGAVVVGTDTCGGVREAAWAGAALAVPRSPDALARAIERLLGDPAGATQLRARARAFAVTELSPERTLPPLVDLYTHLVRRSQRS